MSDLKFYYFRNVLSEPIITICVIKNHIEVFSRGIAICSVNDNPNKKTGRNIAFGRVMKAMVNGNNSLPIKRENLAYTMQPLYEFIKDNFGFIDIKKWIYKSQYNVKLIKFEKKLFKISENN